MPSQTYQLFRTALLDRKQITCTYQGLYREVCPHVLGHTQGQERALVFQFAGQSSGPLPKRGDWRCFSLKDVQNPQLRNGSWKTKPHRPNAQKCVDIIDLDVDT